MSTEDIANLRQDYQREDLVEHAVDADPLAQFRRWFEEARGHASIREPNAMTLATVDAEGSPHARIVLLKGLDERGFTFYTNYESAKGEQLAARPQAALVFFWEALERQVRVEGRVERVGREESEAYFAGRPRGSQVGAWVSAQSTVIEGRHVLEQAQAEMDARFAEGEVPCPEGWGGYVLRPSLVEFWQGRSSRLHDRLRFRRDGESGWSLERLSP